MMEERAVEDAGMRVLDSCGLVCFPFDRLKIWRWAVLKGGEGGKTGTDCGHIVIGLVPSSSPPPPLRFSSTSDTILDNCRYLDRILFFDPLDITWLDLTLLQAFSINLSKNLRDGAACAPDPAALSSAER
jgi:hypothetical protein